MDDATFPHPPFPRHTRNKRTRRTFEGRERQLEPFEMAQAVEAGGGTSPGGDVAVVRLRVPGLDHDGAPPNVLSSQKFLGVLCEVDLLEGRGDRGDPGVAGVGVDGPNEHCVGIAAVALYDGQVRGGRDRVVVRPPDVRGAARGEVGQDAHTLRQASRVAVRAGRVGGGHTRGAPACCWMPVSC